MRSVITMPASPIRRRAGASRAASSPKSNGIRSSSTPRIGFIITNLARSAERVAAFYSQQGHDRSGYQRQRERDQTDTAVLPPPMRSAYSFTRSRITLLHAHDRRSLRSGEPWSLTSLREELINRRHAHCGDDQWLRSRGFTDPAWDPD